MRLGDSGDSIAASAQTALAPQRPKIVGVAHIGLHTDNLDAARKFYGQQLGYEEAFHLDKPEGGLMLIYFKVNDRQYIEVFPGWKGEEQLVLSHIAFETDNAQQLRDYLASKGVHVPDTLRRNLDGNFTFMIEAQTGTISNSCSTCRDHCIREILGRLCPGDAGVGSHHSCGHHGIGSRRV